MIDRDAVRIGNRNRTSLDINLPPDLLIKRDELRERRLDAIFDISLNTVTRKPIFRKGAHCFRPLRVGPILCTARASSQLYRRGVLERFGYCGVMTMSVN